VKEDWQRLRLSEVAKVFDGPHATPKTVDSGPIFLGIGALQDGVINLSETRHVTAEDFVQWTRRIKPEPGDVVFSYETRLGQAAIIPQGLECCLGRRMGLVRFTSEAIDPRFFLYQYLSPQYQDFLDSKTIRGATVDRISIKEFPSFSIDVPSLPEQRRIVAILDEVFEGIATAKTNVERNLQSARSIFTNCLDAMLGRSTWGRRTLGELCDSVEYGSSAKSKADDGVPVLRMGNIQDGGIHWDRLVYTDDKDEIEKYLLKRNDVLFNRTNSPELVGKTAVYKGERPAIFAGYLIRINRKEELLDADFLCYFLNSQAAIDYGKKVVISSVNQANINGTKLKSYPIPAPPLAEQLVVVEKLKRISEATRRFEDLCLRKLAALDELKRSLLYQAFNGQLASARQTKTTPQPALQTTTPEFAANVIALAHGRHERQKREKTFGHVKEQKVLHLVESIGKMDLGRRPMRDAAGPNDFQHMLRAEEWAKANGFFEMAKRGEGYEFKKLSAFDERMSSAARALGPYLPQLERVIDLLVPMDKEEAEVFATVHAAWNNLLIDGADVTDTAIVSAAREDWHADKLNISEHKFRSAIELIRQKGLVPDGTAQYVGGQQSLL